MEVIRAHCSTSRGFVFRSLPEGVLPIDGARVRHISAFIYVVDDCIKRLGDKNRTGIVRRAVLGQFPLLVGLYALHISIHLHCQRVVLLMILWELMREK